MMLASACSDQLQGTCLPITASDANVVITLQMRYREYLSFAGLSGSTEAFYVSDVLTLDPDRTSDCDDHRPCGLRPRWLAGSHGSSAPPDRDRRVTGGQRADSRRRTES